jgi:hypothetical protein
MNHLACFNKSLKTIIFILNPLFPYLIFNNNKTKILLFWMCSRTIFKSATNIFKHSKLVKILSSLLFDLILKIQQERRIGRGSTDGKEEKGNPAQQSFWPTAT